MGSAQSRTKTKLQSIFPNSSDYDQLPSSPSKKPLWTDDVLNYYNLPEQYETAIKDVLTDTTTNVKKCAELEQKTERLISKNIALEENIRKCSADTKKVIELERTIGSLLWKNELMEKNTEEFNKTTVEKVIELEKKGALLNELLLSYTKTVRINQYEIITHGNRVKELDKKVDSIEKLLHTKNAETEGNIKKLQANADGLALMSFTQNNTDLQLDKGVEAPEPEYVNRMMGLLLILIFLVFVLIAMQLQ